MNESLSTEDNDRWFVVVIREKDNQIVSAMSRRLPDATGRPFAGEWGAMTESEANALAEAFNKDPREGGTAEVAELFRYDRDPIWPEQYA